MELKHSPEVTKYCVIDSKGWMQAWSAKLRLAVALSVVFAASTGLAQRPGATNPPAATSHNAHGDQQAPTEDNSDESAMSKQMKAGRDAMRHKLLIEKTHQLLQLTDELRTEVDKTDQNIMSLEVVKKSKEIEKLAKSIHDLMASSS